MRPIALLIAFALLVVMFGCSQPDPRFLQEDPQSAASKAAEDPLVGVKPASVVVLEPAEKKETLGESFPSEVPVPKGEFLATDAQQESWTYTAIVDSPTDGLAAWYRDAYVQRDWEVTSQAGSPDGAYVMNLYKGGAQSHIRITHAQGGGSRVEVTLGLVADIIPQ